MDFINEAKDILVVTKALVLTVASFAVLFVTVKLNIMTGIPLSFEFNGIFGLYASISTFTGTSPLV